MRRSLVNPAVRKLEAEGLIVSEMRSAMYKNRKTKFYSGAK